MKCLPESPEDFMELSSEAWSDMEKTRQVDASLRVSFDRLYYSCFHAAKAALLRLGQEPRTHAGTNSLVGEKLYKENNYLTVEEARTYSKIRTLREQADYEIEINFNEEEFNELKEKSENIIQKMREVALE